MKVGSVICHVCTFSYLAPLALPCPAPFHFSVFQSSFPPLLQGNNPALGPAIIALARQMGVLNCIHGLSSFYWGTYNGPIAADLFLPIVNNTPLPIFLLFNNNGLPLPRFALLGILSILFVTAVLMTLLLPYANTMPRESTSVLMPLTSPKRHPLLIAPAKKVLCNFVIVVNPMLRQ